MTLDSLERLPQTRSKLDDIHLHGAYYVHWILVAVLCVNSARWPRLHDFEDESGGSRSPEVRKKDKDNSI
jgi:hypothetical protein